MPLSQQFTVEVTLTNAEILALPTTPFTIVAAVPGVVLWPMFAHARLNWVVDYTNIDAASVMQIRVGGQDTVIPLREQVISSVSALLAGGGPDGTHAFFSPFIQIQVGTLSSYSNIYDADVVNLPIRIQIDNGLSGVLTGGNAGNSLTLHVVYMVLPI